MSRKSLPFLIATAAIVLTANYVTNAETAKETKEINATSKAVIEQFKPEDDFFDSIVNESGGLPPGLKTLRSDIGFLETKIGQLRGAREQMLEFEAEYKSGKLSAAMLHEAREQLFSNELEYRELISDMNAKYEK